MAAKAEELKQQSYQNKSFKHQKKKKFTVFVQKYCSERLHKINKATPAIESFLRKIQGLGLQLQQKKNPIQLFSGELCKMFQNSFLQIEAAACRCSSKKVLFKLCSTTFLFHKNSFYKNHEAENRLKIKNFVRITPGSRSRDL